MKKVALFCFAVLSFSLLSAAVYAFQLNPGCDLDVRLYGVDAVSDHFLVDKLYQTLVTKTIKWWIYDTRPDGGIGGFVEAGENTSSLFLQHLPGCFNNGSFEINPGCDADAQATGVEIINHQSFVESNQVLLTKGKKWWVYDAYVYEWAGAFIDGGEDITDLFVGTLPACKNDGSFEINPGCDMDVKLSGFDIITHQTLVATNQVLLTKGKKWWVYDASAYDWTGAFIDGGEDFALFLKNKAYYNGSYSPDCFNNGSFELNPGCDPDVQLSGLDAISDYFLVDPLYQVILIKGTKWWVYDIRPNGGTGAFVDGGDDIGALLMTYLPACNVSVCFSNEDCGIDGYIGNYLCENNDVHRNYVYYNCANPGTINSSCTGTVVSLLVDDCTEYEYCIAGNSTCQASQSPPTTQPPSPAAPGLPLPEDIEDEVEELYRAKQTPTNMSDVMAGLEILKLNITDPDLLNRLEEIESRILQTLRSIEVYENQIKNRGTVYQVKWFFGMYAEQEKTDAQFFQTAAGEFLSVSGALKPLAYEIDDNHTRGAIIEKTAELMVKADELSTKAEQKIKNAWGLFSWITSFIAWIISLFSRK